MRRGSARGQGTSGDFGHGELHSMGEGFGVAGGLPPWSRAHPSQGRRACSRGALPASAVRNLRDTDGRGTGVIFATRSSEWPRMSEPSVAARQTDAAHDGEERHATEDGPHRAPEASGQRVAQDPCRGGHVRRVRRRAPGRGPQPGSPTWSPGSADQPERLRTLACNYDCTDERYVDALAEMAEPRRSRMVGAYRGSLPQGFLDIAETGVARGPLARPPTTVHVPGPAADRGERHGHLRAVGSATPRARGRPAACPPHGTPAGGHRRRSDPVRGSDPRSRTAHAVRRTRGGSGPTGPPPGGLRAGQHHRAVIPFAAGAFPGAGQAVVYAEGPVRSSIPCRWTPRTGPSFLTPTRNSRNTERNSTCWKRWRCRRSSPAISSAQIAANSEEPPMPTSPGKTPSAAKAATASASAPTPTATAT